MLSLLLFAVRALAEARARGQQGARKAEVVRVMRVLAEELQRLAEGSAPAAIRCTAVDALLCFR